MTISGFVGGRVRRVWNGGVQRLRDSVLPYPTAKNARAGLWKRDDPKREFQEFWKGGGGGNLKFEEEESWQRTARYRVTESRHCPPDECAG